MRIGIDASCWWSRRGFGRFTRELLKAMFSMSNDHEFYLFVDRAPEPDMQVPGVHIVPVSISKPVTEAAVALGSRSVSDVLSFSRTASGTPLDIMFFPAVYSWFPVRPGLPSIVTMHDAIAEHFPEMIFPDKKGRLFWALKMRLARWQATRVMTVSNSAKQEIEKYLGIRPDKIDVVSEAADPQFVQITDKGLLAVARKRTGVPADVRIIVYVGGLAPHKNIPGLLQGLAGAVKRGGLDDVHLVLVGDIKGDGFHSHFEELSAIVDDEPDLQDRVHFTGYVSDEDLVALYSDALALTLPSFSEGFGLPAIEAMACGIPVLASSAGSVPEVVGDAGLYFDPNDISQIADAIHLLASDNEVVNALKKKALKRSCEFTWERAAGLTITYLENALR